jgi:alkanesulfonate monooxygenase SsuD/methylene tetrahydromethanopterin reductase-like flavin-dependent oxidoreductase (luciferase family)
MTSSAVPAVAALTQSTTFVGFASSVTTLTYQQPVTFTGELTDLRTQAPLAGEPVQSRRVQGDS